MHKSFEDCFYFLTSSCSKGAACPYRHSPLALASQLVCPAWLRADCSDPACPMRHTNSSQRPSTNHGIHCFFENTSMGCLKSDCPFLHKHPRTHLKASSFVPSPKTNTNNPSVANSNPLSPAVNNFLVKDNETSLIKRVEDSISIPDEPKSNTPIQLENITMPPTTQSITEFNRKSTQVPNRIVINSVSKKSIEESTVQSSCTSLSTSSSIRTTVPTRVVLSSSDSDSLLSRSKKRPQESDGLIEQENYRKKSKSLSKTKTNAIVTGEESREVDRSLLQGTNRIKVTPFAKIPTKIDGKDVRGQKSNGHRTMSPTEKIQEGTHLSIEDARRKSRLLRFNKGSQSTPVLTTSTQVSLSSGRTVSETAASIVKYTVHSDSFQIGAMNTPNEVSTQSSKSNNSSVSTPVIHSSSTDHVKISSTKMIAEQLPKSCPVKLQRFSGSLDSTFKGELSTNDLKETSVSSSEDSSGTIINSSDLSVKKQGLYDGRNHTNNHNSDDLDPFILIDEALLEADRILALIQYDVPDAKKLVF